MTDLTNMGSSADPSELVMKLSPVEKRNHLEVH